MTKHTGTLQ